MIIKNFLIKLKTALKNKKGHFNTKYNNEILEIIPELINLNLIKNIQINTLKEEGYLIIYLSTQSIREDGLNISCMFSRKEQRNWKYSTLIKKAKRNEIFLLKTCYGYKDSYFCIKNRIGGRTILKINY
jgi:ribosomal protein S8